MMRPVRVASSVILLAVYCLLLTLLPFALLVATVVGLVTRSTRPPRSVVLVGWYLVVDLTTVGRIARGVEDWDALVRRTLNRGYQGLVRALDLDVALEEGSAAPGDCHRHPGLVVLARHSGPGDSVLIAWLLSVHYRFRLHVVLKSALRWEPLLSFASPHLPLCFVRHGSERTVEGISRTAAALRDGDCLLLFPEGGNFTWRRREEAIRWLASHGHLARARRAMTRTHTLPVRTSGAVAALQAAPGAAVLLLTHSGLSRDGRSRPWWRLPVHLRVDIRTLLLPPSAVPRDEAGIVSFLDQAWAVVDTWVESRASLEALTRST
jgi:1-acyl-sn-glycerol-3-phosphate acyltransferase